MLGVVTFVVKFDGSSLEESSSDESLLLSLAVATDSLLALARSVLSIQTSLVRKVGDRVRKEECGRPR